MGASTVIATLTCELVLSQVRIAGVAAWILGIAASKSTTAVAVVVQALAPFTVTVYVPLSDTVGLAEVALKPPGPVQAYVTFGVAEVALMTGCGTAQVMMLPVALASGAAISWVMVNSEVEVQPLAAVTVTE